MEARRLKGLHLVASRVISVRLPLCGLHWVWLTPAYAIANKGHDTRTLQAYLGHKNIQHTVRYTELTPTRFKYFWRE